MKQSPLNRLQGLILAGIVSGIFSPLLPAAVLVSYPFNSGALAPVSVDPGLIAGDFSGASVLQANYASGFARVVSDRIPGPSGVPGTPADALSAGTYFSFQVAPQSGQTLNLTSLDFSGALYGAGSAGSYTATFFVRSSLDNYGTTVGNPFSVSYQLNSSPSFTNTSINLTDLSFQNLSGPITFRIYLYDSGIAATNRYVGLDNVVLNGVVIPEPTIGLLLGTGLALIWLRRRCRSGP